MREPIRLARPDVGEAELAALAEVVSTGQLTMGPKVTAFEESIANAVGTAHAAVVSSGTAALHLALLALEIGPGDEVIVPAYTFPATANVVELCGAKAVLVDIDPETFNVDVAAVAAAVTPRTRAVMAVHVGMLDGRQAGRLVVAAVNHQQGVPLRRQPLHDGPADEPGSTQNRDPHVHSPIGPRTGSPDSSATGRNRMSRRSERLRHRSRT